MTCAPFGWRISLTEAGLAKGSFRNFRIPPPSIAFYTDHTTAVTRSDGSQGLHGFQQLTMLFDILSGQQMSVVRGFIDDARSTTGFLFLTIDRGDGSEPGPAWIDITGRAHRQPQLSQAGPIVGSQGQNHYTGAQLFLNNVTVVNDPSLYTT